MALSLEWFVVLSFSYQHIFVPDTLILENSPCMSLTTCSFVLLLLLFGCLGVLPHILLFAQSDCLYLRGELNLLSNINLIYTCNSFWMSSKDHQIQLYMGVFICGFCSETF